MKYCLFLLFSTIINLRTSGIQILATVDMRKIKIFQIRIMFALKLQQKNIVFVSFARVLPSTWIKLW